MPVIRNAAGTIATSTTATLVVPYPSNNAGDVLIMAACAVTSGATTGTPANWSLIGSFTSGTPVMNLYWRYAASTLSGSESFTWSTTGNSSGFMVSYSGASNVSPTGVVSNSGSSNTTQSASLGYNGYAVWLVGSVNGNATTLSSLSSTDGTWVPSAAETNSQASNNFYLIDGALATVTTTLNGTLSTFGPNSNIAVALQQGSGGAANSATVAWLRV